LSREKTILPRRATEERVRTALAEFPAHICASWRGFCLTQNRTSICCLRATGDFHRGLSLCSLPVSKHLNGASGACAPSLSRLPARPGSLRSEVFCFFSLQSGGLGRCGPVIFLRLRTPARAGPLPVSMPPACAPQLRWARLVLPFCFSFSKTSARSALCRSAIFAAFHQHKLQVFVALLGKRRSLGDVCRTLLVSTQSAITDGLLQ